MPDKISRPSIPSARSASRPGPFRSSLPASPRPLSILPVSRGFVLFDITSVDSQTDPLFKGIGVSKSHVAADSPLDILGQLAALASAQQAKLADRLHQHWQAMGFSGCALLHTWSSDLRQLLTNRPVSAPSIDQDKKNKGVPCVTLGDVQIIRVKDAALIINVLSRARADLLVWSKEPLLEQRLLSRVYVSDNAQLFNIASQLQKHEAAS